AYRRHQRRRARPFGQRARPRAARGLAAPEPEPGIARRADPKIVGFFPVLSVRQVDSARSYVYSRARLAEPSPARAVEPPYGWASAPPRAPRRIHAALSAARNLAATWPDDRRDEGGDGHRT